MREETSDADDEGKFQFISIHSPHTRGDSVKRTNLWLDKLISIHSPHTRGDDSRRSIKGLYPYFNPLPSYEGRHALDAGEYMTLAISIHSPHTRGDCIGGLCPQSEFYFNPLPSYEGRQRNAYSDGVASRFQSTPLIRGETKDSPISKRKKEISIHSPHTRGDRTHARNRYDDDHFNPLPSYEGRQSVQNIKSLNLRISIHSPHTRGDTTTANTAARGYISIHSPHTRGDICSASFEPYVCISIHSPHTRGDVYHDGANRSFSRFQSTPLIRGETG